MAHRTILPAMQTHETGEERNHINTIPNLKGRSTSGGYEKLDEVMMSRRVEEKEVTGKIEVTRQNPCKSRAPDIEYELKVMNLNQKLFLNDLALLTFLSSL
jgi:hypothetical protein